MKDAAQANKNEIYEGTYAVLEPEIQKLKKLMHFQKDTILYFCDHIRKLGLAFSDKDKKSGVQHPSDAYMWALIRVLDCFSVMDEVKNMKAW